jgi:hypothetical protein
VLYLTKIGWATFWVIFSQTNLAILLTTYMVLARRPSKLT